MSIQNAINPTDNCQITFDNTGIITINVGAGISIGAPQSVYTFGAGGGLTVTGRTSVAATPGAASSFTGGGATLAGTNLAGGNVTIAGGTSTGTGRAFTIISNPTPASASGTADNVAVTRLIAGSIAVVNAGTNIATIPLAANQAANIIVLWGYTATDGVDTHAFCGQSVIAAVNKAAALTSTVTELATWQAKAVSAGTITEAVTVTLAASVLTVKYTPTDSLTPTTQRLDYVMLCLSGQTVTPL